MPCRPYSPGSTAWRCVSRVGWHATASRYSITLLRVGLGVVFLGFGLLKFFPGLSPVEDLVVNTVGVLTFGAISASAGIALVAALECAIGLSLIAGKFMRLTLLLLAFQMLGAVSPLFFFPGELFTGPLHAPSLAAQYIIKDVVLVGAILVIGATLRGGRIIGNPERTPGG